MIQVILASEATSQMIFEEVKCIGSFLGALDRIITDKVKISVHTDFTRELRFVFAVDKV